MTDQDDAKTFYTDVLGFEERTDVRMGDGFRWVTVGHPSQPELEHVAEAVRRALANGTMGGFGLRTDDCGKAYEELSAKGVEFVQPPADRPYGVEAVMRDKLRQLAGPGRAPRVLRRGLPPRLSRPRDPGRRSIRRMRRTIRRRKPWR